MEITKDILYVGVNDHLIDLFEGQYDVPNGMAYNSYLICDEKVAVMDSVDATSPTSGLPRSPPRWASARPTTLSCSTWSRTTPARWPPLRRPTRRPRSLPLHRPSI